MKAFEEDKLMFAQCKLLAALVGMGRAACDNILHRPGVMADYAVLKALVLLKEEDNLLKNADSVISSIHEEKYKIKPKCMNCPRQCGLNDDPEPDEMVEVFFAKKKMEVLDLMIQIANTVDLEHTIGWSKGAFEPLYDAFFELGEEEDPVYLEKVIKELLKKYKTVKIV